MGPSMGETRSSGGRVLGRYRIVRRLAQGGMGVVYLGRLEGAAGFAKPVVIKRVIPDIDNLEETTARFVREAQILSNLQHPGIVGVLDFGEEVGGHCMVLEYIHGYDLSKWLKFLQRRSISMNWDHAVFIMLRVLEALSYAHGFRRSDGMHTEVLHRDVSPGNILLDMEGRVRLADFGIACMDEGEPGQFKTQTGVLKGKVAFLAPELFAGTPPSASSDVYACAVVLYQMLAGRNPFSAENESRVMWRLITEPPTPLSECRDDLPAELQIAVLRALEKEPEARFESADALANSLRKTLVRSESDIGRELRERLRADFTGDLPEMLRMEPLASRDLAWRTGEGLQGVMPDLPPGSFREATPGVIPRGSFFPNTMAPDWVARPELAQPVAVRAQGSSSSQTMTSVSTPMPQLPPTDRSSTGAMGLPPPRRMPEPIPEGFIAPAMMHSDVEFEPTLSHNVLPGLKTAPGPDSASRFALSQSQQAVSQAMAEQALRPGGFTADPGLPPALQEPSSGGLASIRGLSRYSRLAPGSLQIKHVVGIAMSVGLAVAAGLGGIQLLMQRPAAIPTAGRYIVVEGNGKQAVARPMAVPAPLHELLPSTVDAKVGMTGDSSALPDLPKLVAKPRKRTESAAAALSRQFGRKHKQLQGCFEGHASDIEGQPQISVRFDVSASGKVRKVNLSPAALEATALGGCLLGVARATRFSRLEKPIRFTIPIQARAIKR